jgi:acetoin utilization deacetylase AcuC-like enzyme
MKLFFSDAQFAHKPKQFMVHGRPRATTLVDALGTTGLARINPADFGLEPILGVHAEHYVTFLEGAYRRFVDRRTTDRKCCPTCIHTSAPAPTSSEAGRRGRPASSARQAGT